MILITFFLSIGPIILLWLIARGWRLKALQSARDAQDMTLLASNLEGQLKQSEARAEAIAELAKRAIDIAAEKQDTVIQWEAPPRPSEDYSVQVRQYVAPITTSCPRCGVSVRHPPEIYPVRCPASDCQELIDPTFDSGTID